jgi:hypothetical protein
MKDVAKGLVATDLHVHGVIMHNQYGKTLQEKEKNVNIIGIIKDGD